MQERYSLRVLGLLAKSPIVNKKGLHVANIRRRVPYIVKSVRISLFWNSLTSESSCSWKDSKSTIKLGLVLSEPSPDHFKVTQGREINIEPS